MCTPRHHDKPYTSLLTLKTFNCALSASQPEPLEHSSQKTTFFDNCNPWQTVYLARHHPRSFSNTHVVISLYRHILHHKQHHLDTAAGRVPVPPQKRRYTTTNHCATLQHYSVVTIRRQCQILKNEKCERPEPLWFNFGREKIHAMSQIVQQMSNFKFRNVKSRCL